MTFVEGWWVDGSTFKDRHESKPDSETDTVIPDRASCVTQDSW